MNICFIITFYYIGPMFDFCLEGKQTHEAYFLGFDQLCDLF